MTHSTTNGVRPPLALLLVTALAAPAAAAQLVLDPASRLWIDGDSNVHAWTCSAPLHDFAAEAQSVDAPRVPGSLARLVTAVVIKEISCGDSTMDGKLREALKAGEHPRITFVLSSYEATVEGSSAVIHAAGVLTIAGVAKTVVLTGTANRTGDHVQGRGSVALRMTDFGVSPPTALVGVLRTHDEITIRFDVQAALVESTTNP